MELVIGAVALVIGAGLGALLGANVSSRRAGRAGESAEALLQDARRQARKMLDRAEAEGLAKADAYREREDATIQHRRVELESSEVRLEQREATLEQRAGNLAEREQILVDREREHTEQMVAIERIKDEARAYLEQVSGFDAKAAKEELLAKVEDETRREAMILVRDLEVKAREEAERRARRILTSTIQRLASEVVAESTVSVVPLPSDEMKGRIIGRDGRNIRSFEQITGVNIVVDDTPEAVTVSSFDPVRREVARIALTSLVNDGRIHPASIEQAHEKAEAEVEQSIRDAGEWAVLEAGVARMAPELITLLGRLKYRTSYGQNVLNHLVESAQIAEMLAAELGVEPEEPKRAAFLHDIGKAISHEVSSSHALAGAEIARRFGEDPAIVHGIEAHHNEVEPRTLTAIIVQAADSVSAARPGARREALEAYVRRLEKLEELAAAFDGVERVFAMQAGREIRVVVDPESMSDLESADLARRIARRIEAEMQYPGQIEVTVIRELRATDYAK